MYVRLPMRHDSGRHVSDDACRPCACLSVWLQRACALLVVVTLAFFCSPSIAQAAVQGDDYVGATTVTDRGLNVTQAPAVEARYGILVDADGNVLWSRGAYTHSAMASTTKMMTAIVALENGNLSDTYTVSQNAASVGESSAGLRTGDKVTLEALLNGLLVHSGNDAAVAIAEAIAGDVDSFVNMMNEKAEAMGLKDTFFKNPSGLPAEGHYSCASDLSVIARYGMRNSTFREIVGKESVTLDYGGRKRTLKSSNALMCSWDSCIGIKTGFTNAAGQCLVSAASQDGLELYAVVLGCTDEFQRFTDSYKLLDWGFAHYRNYQLASKDDVLVDVPLSGFVNRTVKAGVAEDVNAHVLDYDGNVSIDIKLVDLPDGVRKGQEVGTIIWRQGESVVASAPLVAKQRVGAPMPWTSVITAAVRLLGVFTGDAGVAESKVHVQTIDIEMTDDTAGSVMDPKVDKKIRNYILKYNS